MIVDLPVQELDVVHKGDVIVRLQCDDQVAALAEARGKVAEVDADIAFTEYRLARLTGLVPLGAAPENDMKDWTRNMAVAKARREVAAACVRRLEATVAKYTIRAPIDGTIVSRPASSGEMVSSGQALLTIADLAHTRIEAEVDEFDAGRVQMGGHAFVSADGYPGTRWPAKVVEIPDRSLLQPL